MKQAGLDLSVGEILKLPHEGIANINKIHPGETMQLAQIDSVWTVLVNKALGTYTSKVEWTQQWDGEVTKKLPSEWLSDKELDKLKWLSDTLKWLSVKELGKLVELLKTKWEGWRLDDLYNELNLLYQTYSKIFYISPSVWLSDKQLVQLQWLSDELKWLSDKQLTQLMDSLPSEVLVWEHDMGPTLY